MSDGLYKVLVGDCRERLKELPDNSVDAVVTDPPYELGFMGRKWDRTGIAYDPDLWAEVMRVAKPGAHLLAFSSTRTFHRMYCAIEDGGWRIKDTVMWLHGCLSEDTEILVDGRWEPYYRAIEGCRVLCYDKNADTLQWMPVERFYVYDYDDTAYRICSDFTDQIVSRSHRCLVERGGTLVFERAETLASEQEIRVPILEGVSALLDHLSVPQRDPGHQERPVFDAVRRVVGGCRASYPAEAVVRAARYGRGLLRRLRQTCLESAVLGQTDEDGADVFPSVHGAYAWQGMGQTRSQRQGGMVGGVRTVVFREDERFEQSGVEGRRDLLREEGQLRGREIRPVPAGISGDGAEGRLRGGASADRGQGGGAVPVQDGSGSPSRPRRDEQPDWEPRPLRQQPGSQTVRGSGFARTVVARIEPVRYRGVVWCVKVPTGAFLARRNGKVFITGNSGFPKSKAGDKAIDKIAGAERKVVGEYKAAHVSNNIGTSFVSEERADEDGYTHADVTLPATPEAERWDGWGSALKPSWEPICCSQKPIKGTLAQNLLRHDTGALNIDGCRIKTKGRRRSVVMLGPGTGRPDGEPPIYGDAFYGRDMESVHTAKGRWPANVVLSHLEGCRQVGTRRIKGNPAPTGEGEGMFRIKWSGKNDAIDEDGMEQVEVWECESDCPVRILDEQSGTVGGGHGKRGEGSWFGADGELQTVGFGDKGGASRFFYTSKASVGERNLGLDSVARIKYLSSEWVCAVLNPLLPRATVRLLKKAISGSTITAKDGTEWSMCWCGSPSTDPFHPAIKSTIKTVSRRTTDQKTWNSSARPHTNGCMAAVLSEMVSGGSLAESAANTSPWAQRTGTSAKKDGPATDGADSAISVSSWLTSEPEKGGGQRVGRNTHPT